MDGLGPPCVRLEGKVASFCLWVLAAQGNLSSRRGTVERHLLFLPQRRSVKWDGQSRCALVPFLGTGLATACLPPPPLLGEGLRVPGVAGRQCVAQTGRNPLM